MGTFVRAPSQAAGAVALYGGKPPGDDETHISSTVAFAQLAVGFLILGVLGVEVRQEVIQEALYNVGRTVRAPGDIHTPAQAISYVAAMASPWGSILPATMQQMAGETAVRPIADISQINLPAQVLLEANKALIAMMQTGNVSQPMGDFVERFFPLSRIMSSRTTRSGEADVRRATRALKFAAAPNVEIRLPGGGGGASTKTPMTPVMRNLAQAVARNDRQEIRELTEKAVKMQMAKGYNRKEATRSVQKSLASRSPVQSAFPRRISDAELRRTYSALRPSDRRNVMEVQGRFDRLTKSRRKPKAGKTGSQSIRARIKSRFGKRSALRSRKRRSSLGSAASFSYA
jgi:hypothetical protein